MDRAEAEAVYEAGREACVAFLLQLTSGYEAQIAGLEERIRRLEQDAGRDSRTSSTPLSLDPPKSRQQRRAEARAKAKELVAKRGGAQREAGGQEGHAGAGREHAPEDQVDEIVVTTRPRVVAVGASSVRVSSGPVVGSGDTRCASCRRSA